MHEDARKVHGVKVFVRKVWKMEKATFGRPRFGKRVDRLGRSIDLVQEMHRLCEAENVTQIAALLQARASGHQGIWQDVETTPDSRRWQGSSQRGERLEDRRKEEEDHQKGMQKSVK